MKKEKKRKKRVVRETNKQSEIENNLLANHKMQFLCMLYVFLVCEINVVALPQQSKVIPSFEPYQPDPKNIISIHFSNDSKLECNATGKIWLLKRILR